MKEIINAFCDRYFNDRDKDFFGKGFVIGTVVGAIFGFVLKAVVF
ncbi:hypothetical protein [Phascolarctobacterium sp.]